MTAIFYFTGFLIAVMLIASLFHYPKMMAIKRNYNVGGDNKDKNKLDSIIRKADRPSYTLLINYAFIVVSLLSWLLIGLLSNNWLVFLILLVGYFFISKVIGFIGGKDSMGVVKVALNMLLVIVMSVSCLFISVNHFYIKYDLEYITKTHIVKNVNEYTDLDLDLN